MAYPTFLPFIFCLSFALLPPSSARPFRLCHSHRSSFHFPDFTDLRFLSLFGDAQVSSFPPHVRSMAVQVSGSQPQSIGSLFYSKPIRFLPPFRSRDPLSFSSFFSFSISAKEGNGLAFVISPDRNFNGLPSSLLSEPSAHTFALEFDSKMNKAANDQKAIHDAENPVPLAMANTSDIPLTLNDGDRLYAWIDYHSPANVLEVRLSKSQRLRPWRPSLSHKVDLSNIWKEEMFVGFSSSTGDSPQKHIIYSWSFTTNDGRRHSIHANSHWDGAYHGSPDWHHPHPGVAFVYRMDEVLRIGISLMLGALFGSAVAASMLLLWSLLRRWANPSDGETAMRPILFGYQQLPPEGK